MAPLWMKAKADTSVLQRKLAACAAATVSARKNAGTKLADVFVVAVFETTPKDTNRLSRAWILAGNDAGVSSRPVPPVVQTSRRDEYLRTQLEQLEWMERTRDEVARKMKWQEDLDAKAGPRKDGKPRKKRTAAPYYKKLVRIHRRFTKWARRQREELEKMLEHDDFIYFDMDTPGAKDSRNFSTVRTTVYGGRGEIIDTDGEIRIVLVNMEPHGRRVEANAKNGHPVATAKQIAKARGVHIAGDAYRAQIREAAARSGAA